MKRKLIIVLLLVLGGCTSSNNGTNASELQAKIDEQNIIIKKQEKAMQDYASVIEELNQDITNLIKADIFGGVDEKFDEYYDLNVVNGAADFAKLNEVNKVMNQDLVGIYVGEDAGDTIVLQVYPSGVVVYLSQSNDGRQYSYDGEYKVFNEIGSIYISPLNPGITYYDVFVNNSTLNASTCDGICSHEETRKIQLRKIK